MISSKLNATPAIVEKDYYVSLFLQHLVKKVPNKLFKGGTSLSKCHKVINRFSEDIDLTLDVNKHKVAKKISNKKLLRYVMN